MNFIQIHLEKQNKLFLKMMFLFDKLLIKLMTNINSYNQYLVQETLTQHGIILKIQLV